MHSVVGGQVASEKLLIISGQDPLFGGGGQRSDQSW